MKKKTVITTEKHEIWVVREGVLEAHQNQTTDVSDAIEIAEPDGDLCESGEADELKES
jgi:hypothetical protein